MSWVTGEVLSAGSVAFGVQQEQAAVVIRVTFSRERVKRKTKNLWALQRSSEGEGLWRERTDGWSWLCRLQNAHRDGGSL